MDRSWVHSRLFSPEYVDGVKEFMSFIQGKFNENVEILCPCSRCLNQKYQRQALVKKHILMNGMETTYTRWIHHGESLDVNVIEHPIDMNDNDDGSTHGLSVDMNDNDDGSQHGLGVDMNDNDDGSTHWLGVTEDDNYGDRLEGILGDLQAAAAPARPDVENQVGAEQPRDRESFLKIVMREVKRQLYPGCTKFSRFSFVVRLFHMKSLYRISNSAFSAHMNFLADAFPEYNALPKSYDEAKGILKEMGLGYESIHVCYNNCVPFRKGYKNYDNCSVCGLSRWKDAERKKIPQKVLRHFPLAPRLKRMFSTKEASKAAQWHKLKRQPIEKNMSHPADGEAWQDFDREYPDFAKDARNLRLGLATNGFNPFSEKNTKYSM
ncbi:uncharacterized protein LOC120644152 isoform X1 [Panicum virgatum]|uniref:uncharacterized protein LOC120644152 isoform X1 n=1 Tax=Panicum virgatum TaxID=38727 RepID=UPI0019D4FA7D|nr:uncharacterized protein LOC120644152 isoform X1 [Panicum virgatum]XP_039776647.1 uncharacterized protein LOC120644152 isoform X1 [Panicum virgatum]XP_039776648.1 uncharacterized protein LOC120644152 isoform X1 [Panicum virgatum]